LPKSGFKEFFSLLPTDLVSHLVHQLTFIEKLKLKPPKENRDTQNLVEQARQADMITLLQMFLTNPDLFYHNQQLFDLIRAVLIPENNLNDDVDDNLNHNNDQVEDGVDNNLNHDNNQVEDGVDNNMNQDAEQLEYGMDDNSSQDTEEEDDMDDNLNQDTEQVEDGLDNNLNQNTRQVEDGLDNLNQSTEQVEDGLDNNLNQNIVQELNDIDMESKPNTEIISETSQTEEHRDHLREMLSFAKQFLSSQK